MTARPAQRLLTTLSTGLLGIGFRPRLLPCRLRCHLCHQQQGFLRVHRPVPRARGDHRQGLSGPAGRRDFMRETAAMPYKFYSQETCVPGKDFGPYDENTFIPRFKKTESIKFFVSGGPGKQSQIWVPFPQVFKPVSKKIAE